MSNYGPADWIGWLAGMILLVTVSRQVWTQYRTRSTAGVSRWLFVGQVAASTGFVVYSFAKGDALFVFTNMMLLIVAVVGQLVDRRNRALAQRQMPAS
ncbi:MAG: PQ-loop repeat-containing protein [Burkholderiales bacterium]|nr:PQ-loop repeat-containing protein [Burkholderiales bacterium]